MMCGKTGIIKTWYSPEAANAFHMIFHRIKRLIFAPACRQVSQRLTTNQPGDVSCIGEELIKLLCYE
jgi:hypothetical protein